MADQVDPEGLDTATTVAKNSASMLVVALLTRGTGLIVAVLVARYLGAAALGTYAVVMGMMLLVEAIAPFGQRYVVIREVARERSRLLAYWLNTSLTTAAFSVLLAGLLILFIHLAGYDPSIRPSVYVVSLSLPVAGLYIIAQAVLQGMERMEYLAIAALLGQVLGLLALWILLEAGLGVVAAFWANGLSLLAGFVVLAWAIVRHGREHWASRDLRLDLDLNRATLRVSFPFAVQQFLSLALTRATVIILPLLLAMEAVGIFDAADRIRQTSAMIIPMITMATLPTLSRKFLVNKERSEALVERVLKFLLILSLPFVLLTAITADQIIPLFYGAGYQASVPLFRIVVWAQVFFVVDEALRQHMMASNNEVPMVRRGAISLLASILLTLGLASVSGLVGAAWAVVLTRALNLALDAQFVIKGGFRIRFMGTVGKPALCAILSGAVAFLLRHQVLPVPLGCGLVTYVGLLLLLGTFSRNELLLMRQLPGRFWKRTEG